MKRMNSWSIVVIVGVLSAACDNKEERAKATLAESPDAAPTEAAGLAVSAVTEEPGAEAPSVETVVYELDGSALLEWVGYKMVGSQTGSFLLFEGKVEVPCGDVTRAKMECIIEMESLISDSDTLTTVMKSDKMFNVEAFPEGRFTSRSVRRTDTGYEVTGAIELMGVERVISFPAEINLDEDVFTLKATFEVDRTWWGITWKGFGDNIMKDQATIRLNIVAKEGL